MFNNNWQTYFTPALPNVEKQIAETLLTIIQGLFKNVPYRTLFPSKD